MSCENCPDLMQRRCADEMAETGLQICRPFAYEPTALEENVAVDMMREEIAEKAIVKGLSYAQERQVSFEHERGLERTPLESAERMAMECQEMHEALALLQADDTPENYRKVAIEAVDVIIGALAVVANSGYDAGSLFVEKMKAIEAKYDVVRLKQLREAGMTPNEAMERVKKEWKGGK